jgi:malate dehydrogenase
MRLAIVGAAGGVGSATAFACVLTGAVDELVLVDRSDRPLSSHVLDLEQLRGPLGPFAVSAGTLGDAADADVLLVTASAAHRDGPSRMDYLRENAAIVDEIAAGLEQAPAAPGTIVVATNPVDPLCTLLQRRLGRDRATVVGYTIHDSLRLRFGIAQALGVAPGRVEAWSLGEHGPHAVLLLDRVLVDGERVELSLAEREFCVRYARGWYDRWQRCGPGRTPAWTSGYGLAALVSMLARAPWEPYAASVVLDGEYGIDDVSLTVPVRVGHGRVEPIVWDLAQGQLDGLAEAARAVGAAVASVAPSYAAT